MGDRELKLDKSEAQRIGKYLFEPLEEIDNLNACIEEVEEMLQKVEEQLRTAETESLRNSYVAEKKILNELIAEYNAKAMAIKYEDFRKRNLPQEIEFYRGE